MPSSAAKQYAPLVLVCGEDEFAVKQRAKEIYLRWTKELGGADHEIIDASVSNSGEALKAVRRLREALQTLPFFGTRKGVWLQDCNFLGEERTATAAPVSEALADLAEELKTFPWDNVRLLISAGKVDKRKVFYRTLDKIGTVEILAGWSADDRDWADQMRGSSIVRSKNWHSMPATKRASNWRMWKPFAFATRPQGRLRLGTRWAIGTCPTCYNVWTKNSGRLNSIPERVRSACSTG